MFCQYTCSRAGVTSTCQFGILRCELSPPVSPALTENAIWHSFELRSEVIPPVCRPECSRTTVRWRVDLIEKRTDTGGRAMQFRMRVVDVFHMSGGRTIFVGIVDGVPRDKLIGPSKAELLVDGVVVARINLEGEELVESSTHRHLRSLSTSDTVPVSSAVATESVCELRKL